MCQILSQCVQFHGSNSVCIHRTNVHFQDGEVLRRHSNNFSIPQFSCGNLWQSAAAWLRAARGAVMRAVTGKAGLECRIIPGTAGWMLLFCCSLGLSAVETLSRQSAYTRGVRGGHKWNLCVFPAGWLLGWRAWPRIINEMRGVYCLASLRRRNTARHRDTAERRHYYSYENMDRAQL